MIALILTLMLPDHAALGSPDWRTRESATERLRAAGLLAYPAIQAGLASEDPEVRQRCNILARRQAVVIRSLQLRFDEFAVLLWIADPRGGWVNEADAREFAADGRYHALDRIMQVKGWSPAEYRTPWDDGCITRVEYVMAVANYYRSCWRGSNAVPWPLPWKECVTPKVNFPG